MLADFLIPFFTVGLAEFGDKTQLSVLLLSSKTKKHSHLLIGIVLAFLLVDGIAVVAGSLLINIISPGILKTVSGIIFILFGIVILKEGNRKGDSRIYSKSPFFSGFMLIFLTEWGDKTQILSAVLATKYNPLMVLMATMLSLALLSALTVYFGKIISTRVDSKKLTKLAGGLFIILGVSVFLF